MVHSRIAFVLSSFGFAMALASAGDERGPDRSPVPIGYGPVAAPGDRAVAANRARRFRVDFDRGDLIEWFANDSRGLEQSFTIAKRPEGGGELPLLSSTAPPAFGLPTDVTLTGGLPNAGGGPLFVAPASLLGS